MLVKDLRYPVWRLELAVYLQTQSPIRDWKPALNRFAIEFAERFPQ